MPASSSATAAVSTAAAAAASALPPAATLTATAAACAAAAPSRAGLHGTAVSSSQRGVTVLTDATEVFEYGGRALQVAAPGRIQCCRACSLPLAVSRLQRAACSEQLRRLC